MRLLNRSGMTAGYTLGMDPTGRESVVVAVKGTFVIPARGDEPAHLADEQVPLIEADAFTGEPGFSAPLYEADYAPIKPCCDVLLVGSAYAPGGEPVERVRVGLKVGPIEKLMTVYGERVWVATGTGFLSSRALPFTKRPISYDIAFGGVDRAHPDESRHDAYLANPVGIGFHKVLDKSFVEGASAPSTEACDDPVRRPDGRYRPMAFGPVGRGWSSRIVHGGTYDDAWLENTFPFLPADFDERYHQCAPEDQQMPYPTGGETVTLLNLTPEGRCRFSLPARRVPVCFFRDGADRVEKEAVIDTLVIEPDAGRFTMTWRASLPLRRNLFEIPEILVGTATRGWWRARELGKTWYPSLDAVVRKSVYEDEAEEET